MAGQNEETTEKSSKEHLDCRRWSGFGEFQKSMIETLKGEITHVSEVVEESVRNMSTQFGALAKSARKQAETSQAIVQSVSNIELEGEDKKVNHVLRDIDQFMNQLMYEFAQVGDKKNLQVFKDKKDYFSHALNLIMDGNEKSQGFLTEVQSASKDLTETTNSLIVMMQFQDMTKQRLDHVLSAMDVIKGGISDLQDSIKAGEDYEKIVGTIPEKLIEKLLEGCTLSEIRDRYIEGLVKNELIPSGKHQGANDAKQAVENPEDDVMLF